MTTRILMVSAVLLATVACGGAQKESEQASQAADTASGTTSARGPEGSAETGGAEPDMAQIMRDMAALGQGDGKAGSVPVVDFEKLKAFVPTVGGWTRSEVKGSQSAMGEFSVSQAEADYTKGEARVELEISDSSFNPMFTAAFSLYGINYSERSDEGYKKGTKVGGFPAYESWDASSKRAELHVLVGNRFIVQVEGNDLDGTGPLQAVAAAIDLQKLAALR